MRSVAVVVLLSIILAGCVGTPTDEPAPSATTNDSAVFPESYALKNESIPKEELQNASLGAEHIHDAWGGAEQLVLLDDTLVADTCEGAADATFYAVLKTFEGDGPALGCTRIYLPEGVVVPEGAGKLLIEVDAADALKSGGMQFQFRNKAREENAGSTTDAQHVWDIALEPADWDIAHASATSWVMYLAASGPAAVFDGDVNVRVVAEKAEGWQPILAIAHVDHWKLPQLHELVAPHVMRLLDSEGSVTNIDPMRFTGSNFPEPIPLDDIIPPGTKTLTIVADRTSQDCVPAIDCWLVPQLQVGGYERTRFGELIFHEGERWVYAFRVPNEVPEDSVYAEISTAVIQPRINACMPTAGEATCGFASMASGSATARLLVLAWHGDVDIDLLVELADA